MKEYCADLKILPWNEEKEKNIISSPDKIPETTTQLQKHFPGKRSMDSGGDVFAKVHLAFPVITNRINFERDIQSWGKPLKI